MELLKDQTYSHEEMLTYLVAEYEVILLRTCYMYLHDKALAEDATQETFLKAYKALDSFRGESSEKTWLMHIAMNVCRDVRRTRWFRHVDMRKALEEIPQGVASVLPEDRALLMDIMALPDKYKEPLLLYYYQDMTIEETAQLLGVSKSTIHNRLRKAEGLLKLVLKGGDCYV